MATHLTKADVAHVAALARLSLSDAELEAFTEQLSAVLGYAEALVELDIENVAPTVHALGLMNVLRADTPLSGCDRDEVLAAAPEAQDGRFKVPRILGEAP